TKMKYLIFSILLILSLFTLSNTKSLRGLQNSVFLNETYDSGYLPSHNGGEIFYILFHSRSHPKTDPLVIWLTGGPGCSGEIAMFTENGPFGLNKGKDTLSTNPHSWN